MKGENTALLLMGIVLLSAALTGFYFAYSEYSAAQECSTINYCDLDILLSGNTAQQAWNQFLLYLVGSFVIFIAGWIMILTAYSRDAQAATPKS